MVKITTICGKNRDKKKKNDNDKFRKFAASIVIAEANILAEMEKGIYSPEIQQII